jgi:hypothetical protein
MKGICWQLDVWDSIDALDCGGLRFRFNGGEGSADGDEHIEYAFVMTREQAYQQGLLDKATHGDSSAGVDVHKLPPETEVEVWGGMVERRKMAEFLRKVLVMIDEGGR